MSACLWLFGKIDPQVVVGASLVLVAQLCESCAETVLALRIETL